jgi:predicted lipoprotein
MSYTPARNLALMAALLSGLPAAAAAQGDINQDNTAYGTTSAEFLLFGAGARGAALGGAFQSIATDVSALYYNPAGIALMPRAGL